MPTSASSANSKPPPESSPEATAALIRNPRASDFELLGHLVTTLARLRESPDQSVRLAVRQLCRFGETEAPTPLRPASDGPGRRVSPEIPQNAPVIYYLHRLLRFLDGNNLSAAPGTTGHIKYPDHLASDAASLPALSEETEAAWFNVLWRMVEHDYRDMPCLPGISRIQGLPHNLHTLVGAQYHDAYAGLVDEFRAAKLRAPNAQDEIALQARAAANAAHILRHNSRRAFQRIVRGWESIPQLASFPSVFRAFRQKAE